VAAAVLDGLVAASFCLLGPAMWRRPTVAPAVLMMASGLAWLLGDLGSALVFAHRGPLVHLLVGYPRIRLRGRLERAVVAFGYLDAAVYPLGRLNGVTLGLAAATVGVVARGHTRARGAERRARLTSLASSGAVAGSLAVGAAARLTSHPLDHPVLVVYELSLAATAIALFADQRWGRWNRSAITGLVLDLGDAEQPTSLRDKLAAALGDPSLQVGYPAPEVTRLVDEAGRPFELPPPTLERPATVVRDDDHELAVLVHDRIALDDPALLESVTALAKIALANVRLQADIVATAARIEESRRRLLAVAVTERQRLEAELQSGAQARLARVQALLADGSNEHGLREQVRVCRDAVSDFARGVHPRVLTEQGLSAALVELIAHSPVPVELDVKAGRCRDEVEVAAYYVCAEALTNIAKYADATAARILVSDDGASLYVAVADDGRGGAKIGGGSGLIGLADRLDVLGGTFTIDSPPGHGTTLDAAIPLVSR
jgi:signal transduction histidine kinase